MNTTFSYLVTRFFSSYLPHERGTSQHTIMSYRDCFRLLIGYACERLKLLPEQLDTLSFTRDFILEFLDHLQRDRGNGISTRNQRLSVIKSFFHFAALTEPSLMELCTSIQSISRKKTEHRNPPSLTQPEIDAIISSPDGGTVLGARDKAMLQLAHNTGARVQEIADLEQADIRLEAPLTVTVTGKGGRTRTVPILPETAAMIGNYLQFRQQHGIQSEHLFLSNTAQPMTRFGIAKRFQKHAESAAEQCPSLKQRCVTPHLFRHTIAFQLFDMGSDIKIVQEWLGHADMKTTSQYARISLLRKQQALEKCPPVAQDGEKSETPKWKETKLMTFLSGLSNKARYVPQTPPKSTCIKMAAESAAT